jgi:hypothetical protein
LLWQTGPGLKFAYETTIDFTKEVRFPLPPRNPTASRRCDSPSAWSQLIKAKVYQQHKDTLKKTRAALEKQTCAPCLPHCVMCQSTIVYTHGSALPESRLSGKLSSCLSVTQFIQSR